MLLAQDTYLPVGSVIAGAARRACAWLAAILPRLAAKHALTYNFRVALAPDLRITSLQCGAIFFAIWVALRYKKARQFGQAVCAFLVYGNLYMYIHVLPLR